MPSNATRRTWNSGEGTQRSEKQGVRSPSLFKFTKYKLNSDLENLISFSVIYRLIGLRHEITEICSINRKHRSNWTVTLTKKTLLTLWKSLASTDCPQIFLISLNIEDALSSLTKKTLLKFFRKLRLNGLFLNRSYFYKYRRIITSFNWEKFT